MKNVNIHCVLVGACALWSWLLWTDSVPAQAPFYQDKTITVVAGTDCPNVAIVSGYSLHRELELLDRAEDPGAPAAARSRARWAAPRTLAMAVA